MLLPLHRLPRGSHNNVNKMVIKSFLMLILDEVLVTNLVLIYLAVLEQQGSIFLKESQTTLPKR